MDERTLAQHTSGGDHIVDNLQKSTRESKKIEFFMVSCFAVEACVLA